MCIILVTYDLELKLSDMVLIVYLDCIVAASYVCII